MSIRYGIRSFAQVTAPFTLHSYAMVLWKAAMTMGKTATAMGKVTMALRKAAREWSKYGFWSAVIKE